MILPLNFFDCDLDVIRLEFVYILANYLESWNEVVQNGVSDAENSNFSIENYAFCRFDGLN